MALNPRDGCPTAIAPGPNSLFGPSVPVEIQLDPCRPLPAGNPGLPPHPRSPFHAPVLLIPLRCDRSPLHGLGLFAISPIRAGTPIWRFIPGFDQSFTPHQLDQLPDPARSHVQHYGYFDAHAGHWVLNGDLTIFMNHSATPNTGAPASPAGAATETIALRDIPAGEEVTCDYHAFDASTKPIPPSHPPM